MDQRKSVIVIPTYNEAENIVRLINEILSQYSCFDILVVDDSSSDGTADKVRVLSRTNSNIMLLSRNKKMGIGSAYIEGFKKVLSMEEKYGKIFQMDADFSHSPQYLKAMLKSSDRYDVVLGSRYVLGGDISDWNIYRRAVSLIGNFYTRIWLGFFIKDWTTGFRCLRREVLEKINLDIIQAKGYLFQIESVKLYLDFGFIVSEIPIKFIERKKGKTKLGIKQIWEAVIGVILLKLSSKKMLHKVIDKT